MSTEISTSDLVPSNVPEKPEEFTHYYDMAREIVRRVRHRDHLSDDEIIVLAMVAAQISLSQYVEPHRELDPDDTLNAILDILDRGEVLQAVSSKMLWLLNHRPPARLNAPAGTMLDEFEALIDEDEPGGALTRGKHRYSSLSRRKAKRYMGPHMLKKTDATTRCKCGGMMKLTMIEPLVDDLTRMQHRFTCPKCGAVEQHKFLKTVSASQ